MDAEVRKLVGAVLAVADGFRNYCRNKRDGRRFRAAQKLSAEGTVLAYGATRQAGGFWRPNVPKPSYEHHFKQRLARMGQGPLWVEAV